MRASRRTFRQPAVTPIVTAVANARRSRSRRPTAAAPANPPRTARSGGAGRNGPLAALNATAVLNEFVAEIDGSLTDAQADALARRHGLVRLQSQNFPLVGATIGLFRITDGRPVEKARRAFAAAAGVRSVQLNFRYWLTQNQKAALTEGDPAQYALAKLRLPQAHTLGQRRQRDHRRDRFRNRRQASGTPELGCGQFRRARQQGRPACSRHRHRRRDRVARAG